MDFTARVLFILFTLLTAFTFKVYRDLSAPVPIPTNINIHKYWGPNDNKSYKEDTSIHQYKIYYDDKVINELHNKLDNVGVLHKPLESTEFEYGFNSNELYKIVTYWKDIYLKKWRQREAYLNQFPHFKTQIQGLDIHFIHVKPVANVGVKVIPILLLHGFPGSVREFYGIIPKLVQKSDDKDYVFEVIAPSLPGYGWSQPASKTGFGTLESAIVIRNLMLRLGHNKFFIHCGDWGAFIGSNIASIWPENVLGYHSNMCSTMSPIGTVKGFISTLYPTMFVPEKYVDWIYPLSDNIKDIFKEMGYLYIQATKPDTIGIALSHNPIGLAAYILEKFSTWTNRKHRNLPGGGLDRFNTDDLLDNIMIYYLTNSITTACRLYSEFFNNRELSLNLDRIGVKVPAGCVRFKNELVNLCDWQLKDKFSNLIHSTYENPGGHFATMELPDVMYRDLMEFIKKVKV